MTDSARGCFAPIFRSIEVLRRRRSGFGRGRWTNVLIIRIRYWFATYTKRPGLASYAGSPSLYWLRRWLALLYGLLPKTEYSVSTTLSAEGGQRFSDFQRFLVSGRHPRICMFQTLTTRGKLKVCFSRFVFV